MAKAQTLTLKTPLSHPAVQWAVIGGTLVSAFMLARLVFVGRSRPLHPAPAAVAPAPEKGERGPRGGGERGPRGEKGDTRAQQ